MPVYPLVFVRVEDFCFTKKLINCGAWYDVCVAGAVSGRGLWKACLGVRGNVLETGRRMRGSGVRNMHKAASPEALLYGTAEEERILTLYGDS